MKHLNFTEVQFSFCFLKKGCIWANQKLNNLNHEVERKIFILLGI